MNDIAFIIEMIRATNDLNNAWLDALEEAKGCDL